MKQVLEDFDERVGEIDAYFAFLADLEQPNARLVFEVDSHDFEKGIDSEWLKTLKATSFLLIYNLVEAAIRSALGSLYETMKREGRSYEDLREEIRSVWIDQRFRRVDRHSASLRDYQDVARVLVSHAVDRLTVEIDSHILPKSGNLDAEKVREICHLHGIPVDTPASGRGGADLAMVVKQRNDLAHGNVSFRECGRNFTVSQLCATKEQAVVFVKGILLNIQKYITEKAYVA